MTNMGTSKPARPIAGSIGTVFGGLWGVVGALALAPAWRLPAGVVAATVTAVLLWRLWSGAASASGPLFRRAAYRWAVVFELVAIYAASAVLPRLGGQKFFIQVVGLIVGLHFIGLYVATRAPRFRFICVAMCLVSAGAMLLPGPAHDVVWRDAVTGFGNALVLWLGVAALA